MLQRKLSEVEVKVLQITAEKEKAEEKMQEMAAERDEEAAAREKVIQEITAERNEEAVAKEKAEEKILEITAERDEEAAAREKAEETIRQITVEKERMAAKNKKLVMTLSSEASQARRTKQPIPETHERLYRRGSTGTTQSSQLHSHRERGCYHSLHYRHCR